MRRRSLLRSMLVPCLLWATLAADGARAGDDLGVVRGRVEITHPDLTLAQVGPVVVYLERIDAANTPPQPGVAAEVIQLNAQFEPDFLVVTRGQTLQMPNSDAIYHNVFSFSRPNDFDLGLYPAGESRSVVFEHAGVVKAYCSIHESMNATIFVAPGPHHALVRTDGRFEMKDVPPGRYRLSTWCERLPATSRELVVEPGGRLDIGVQLMTLAP